MKINSYLLLSGAALFGLLAAQQPCFATAYDVADTTPYVSAGVGNVGTDLKTGQPTTGHGNTNVPFSAYPNLSQTDVHGDINPATQDPFDETPIHEMNNVVNADGSTGQQIYDYSANNGRAQPTSWVPATYKQIPCGPDPIHPSQEVYSSNEGTVGITGLAPTTTAIQAGAVPGKPGVYSFPALDPGIHALDYGFDTHPYNKQYAGSYNANNYYPGVTGGYILPPTSTGGVY